MSGDELFAIGFSVFAGLVLLVYILHRLGEAWEDFPEPW